MYSTVDSDGDASGIFGRIYRVISNANGIVENIESCTSCTQEEKDDLFARILQKLELMDRLKFNKFELTNPYKHIIIKEGLEPVMIDFERAKYTSRPKNVNQFTEYVRKHTSVSDAPEK